MKIFQSVDNPYASVNQYVMTLMDGINCHTDNVEWGWGIESFWKLDIFNYDIIHIQWPHALLLENRTSCQLDSRLDKLKKAGKKIIATCHNLEPHYCNNPEYHNAYSVVYKRADMIIHLGTYSFENLSKQFHSAEHVILPHHVYDTFYKKFPDKPECCEKLKIKNSSEYILCFGAFRDVEEKKLALSVADYCRGKNLYVLAPSFKQTPHGNRYSRFKHYIKERLLNSGNRIICHGYANNCIPNELTPYYFGASSIILIQRKQLLNSGNITLAFLMGKVVVGPDIGNVGQILKDTGNPTFDVSDDNSIITAIQAAFNLAKENHGIINKEYALKHLSTDIISERLYNYYVSLQHNCRQQ